MSKAKSRANDLLKLQDTFCMPILLGIQKWLPFYLLNESAFVACGCPLNFSIICVW